jgi:hypothetical protein
MPKNARRQQADADERHLHGGAGKCTPARSETRRGSRQHVGNRELQQKRRCKTEQLGVSPVRECHVQQQHDQPADRQAHSMQQGKKQEKSAPQ